METGECVRKSVDIYLDNPILIVPFIIAGVLYLVVINFLTTSFKTAFSSLNMTGLQAFLFSKLFASEMLRVLSNYMVLFLLSILFIAIVYSFVQAYSIGLAKKIVTEKKVSLKDGFATIGSGVQIFFMLLSVFGLIIAGLLVSALISIILFGAIGIILSAVAVLIYSTVVVVAVFFAPQSIVLENKGPWEGIASSYRFIKKNIESSALLLLFIGFIYVSFLIMEYGGATLGSYFLSEITFNVLSKGLNLLLFSVVFSPYVVVLKTYFFMKNK